MQGPPRSSVNAPSPGHRNRSLEQPGSSLPSNALQLLTFIPAEPFIPSTPPSSFSSQGSHRDVLLPLMLLGPDEVIVRVSSGFASSKSTSGLTLIPHFS